MKERKSLHLSREFLSLPRRHLCPPDEVGQRRRQCDDGVRPGGFFFPSYFRSRRVVFVGSWGGSFFFVTARTNCGTSPAPGCRWVSRVRGTRGCCFVCVLFSSSPGGRECKRAACDGRLFPGVDLFSAWTVRDERRSPRGRGLGGFPSLTVVVVR